MRPIIHTVGDSHAEHAWCKIPGVKARSVGPMLMYTFGNNVPEILYGVPKDDIVCFCWGEIDCRCHVHKYQPWQQTIEHLVFKYLAGIRKLTKGFKEVWIYNVVPPPKKGIFMESESFPFLGSDEERLAYVTLMNEFLRKSEFIFVDIYKNVADADGYLNWDQSDCHVHVEDPKPLMEWIDRRFNSASS